MYNITAQTYRRNKDTSIHKNLSETILSTGIHYPYILINDQTKRVELITSRQKFIWDNLVRSTNVKRLAMAYLQEFGYFAIDEIQILLERWCQSGFIANTTHKLSVYRKLVIGKIKFRNFDRIANLLYMTVGKLIFNKFIRMVGFAFTCIGTGMLIADIINPNSTHTIHLDLLSLAIIGWLSTVLHELGHVLVAKHFGTRVTSAGIKFILGLPVFYVDTSEMWAKPRSERIRVSMAGISTNFVLMGLTSLLTFIIGPNKLLAYFTYINFFSVLANLIPFFGFDGYFVLTDLIEIANLRSLSYRLLTGKHLPDNLRPNQQLFLESYALISIVATLGILMFAIYSWSNTFALLVS